MTVEFIKIEEISTDKVWFYTVRLGDREYSEFELFDDIDFNNHYEEFQILTNIIKEIGERGAKMHHFRPEDSANALPGKQYIPPSIIEANNSDYGIRLYCIRVNYNIVILLNGGIKTKLKAQDCPNIKQHFKTAVTIGRKLDKAIESRDINISDLNCFDEYTIEI